MAIFKCGSCEYEREVPERLVGKKARCPECGRGVEIVAETLTVEFADEDFEPTVESGTQLVSELPDEPEQEFCDECGRPLEAPDGTCVHCGASVVGEEPHVGSDSDAPKESDEYWDGGSEAEIGVKAFSVASLDVPSKAGWAYLARGGVFSNVYAGLISGLLAFFFAVALAMLAVAHPSLQGFFPEMLTMALVATVVGGLIYTAQSGIPFGLAGPETALSAVLFLFLGAIYRSMVGVYPSETILPTVLVAVALSALISGFGFYLIGRLRAGRYIRFIPVHIVGGVIGAVGVFVVLAALGWMGDGAFDWTNVPQTIQNFDAAAFSKDFPPSIVLAVLLFIALCRVKNSLFMLSLIIVAAGVGYASGIWGNSPELQSLSVSLPVDRAGIRMLGMFFLPEFWSSIRWEVIQQNNLYIGAVALLSILASMTRVTALEVVHEDDVEIDQEFRALGVANVASGLFGGMPLTVSYGRSMGGYSTGARGPLSGIVAVLVCFGLFVYLDMVLPLIPKFVIEGLLIFLGLGLIHDWLFKTRSSFTRRDDIHMLWLVFVVSLVLGMLAGIGFGVGLAIMATVARYGRGGPVRNVLTGATHTSHVDRPPAQQRALREYGDHIHIMRLQGFLFLGSMIDVLRRIHARIRDTESLPVEYIILDFSMVTGLASAVDLGFKKLRNLALEHEIDVIITSAPLDLEEHLTKGGYAVNDMVGSFKIFHNLDYAMEWCENRVLEGENMQDMVGLDLPRLLEPVFPDTSYIRPLMEAMQRIVVDKNQPVFRQGGVSDAMYFVESGSLDVELEMGQSKIMRLKRLGPGAVFGEMGIYTNLPRSATVRAVEKCVLYRFSKEKVEEINRENPGLLAAVDRYLIVLLSERLAEANKRARDLMY